MSKPGPSNLCMTFHKTFRNCIFQLADGWREVEPPCPLGGPPFVCGFAPFAGEVPATEMGNREKFVFPEPRHDAPLVSNIVWRFEEWSFVREGFFFENKREKLNERVCLLPRKFSSQPFIFKLIVLFIQKTEPCSRELIFYGLFHKSLKKARLSYHEPNTTLTASAQSKHAKFWP